MAKFRRAKTITKSDTVDVPFGKTDAIYVGGVGDLVVTTLDGDLVTFTAVPAGTTIELKVRLVMAATTATLIIGLYN